MNLIGIFGGSFNPIHIGHLIMANEVLIKLNLEKIVFIPAGNPPHKNLINLASTIDRYNMVKLSIEDNKKFEVSDIEIKKQCITYTYDTLKELKEIYKESKLYFIIGFDSLKELDTWKNIDKMNKYCDFVVVDRNSNSEQIDFLIKEYKQKYNLSIHYVETPNINISSTMIRQRVKDNINITYMVDKKVEEYIYNHKLFRR